MTKVIVAVRNFCKKVRKGYDFPVLLKQRGDPCQISLHIVSFWGYKVVILRGKYRFSLPAPMPWRVWTVSEPTGIDQRYLSDKIKKL
jgi:hypothetical protein